MNNIIDMFDKAGTKKESIDIQVFLSELNKSFSLITDIDQLNYNFTARIRDIINVSSVLVLLLDPEINKFLPIKDRKSVSLKEDSIYFLPGDKLIFWFNVNRTHLLIPENPAIYSFLSKREQEILSQNRIVFIYPFVIMNQVKGLVLLGEKVSGQEYLNSDIELLKTFLDPASFAYENAFLYQQQKERTRKMYRADRLATLGELAAGTAHEIRNPLTTIRSTIQYLEKRLQDPKDKTMAHDLITEVDRINEIIQRMLSFARPEKPSMEKSKLKEIIEQTIILVETTAKKKNITIDLEYDTEEELIVADTGQIKQVLLNVMMNALQAIQNKNGKILITVNMIPGSADRYTADKRYFIIRVMDNGKGIPKKDIDKIFDPFFTTKPDGTGLGLSITYGIVHKHAGEIEVTSEETKGTTVTIKLPTKM
jgi:signal transduction histidine kinase